MPEPSNYWKLADNLTVIQAALLIINEDPTELQYALSDTETKKPEHFEAVFHSIINSIGNNKLKSNMSYYPLCVDEIEFGGRTEPLPNWDETTIDTDDLKAWLFSRNFKENFFFAETSSDPDYLNKDHPRYSAKLAAAVNVWLAMEDSNLLAGKSVKSAIESWLESRYLELGLIHEGKINKTGINECFKVANWNDKGGATKTP
ncbi:MAG: hypothetical protein Q8N30_16865 [Methylococcales bacterium]|jgi:hypothetical protein|nr:hypothetical protein [Methylococcales bacterium]